MTSETRGAELRRARELVFAVGTAWLFLQNLVLLLILAGALPHLGLLLAAVVRSALLPAAPHWALPAVALAAWAMTAGRGVLS